MDSKQDTGYPWTYGRKHLDPRGDDGDDKWRAGGVSSTVSQSWIVGRDEQPDDGDTANVKQKDTDIYTPDGLREVPSRILGFTGSDLKSKELDLTQCMKKQTCVRRQSLYR